MISYAAETFQHGTWIISYTNCIFQYITTFPSVLLGTSLTILSSTLKSDLCFNAFAMNFYNASVLDT